MYYTYGDTYKNSSRAIHMTICKNSLCAIRTTIVIISLVTILIAVLHQFKLALPSLFASSSLFGIQRLFYNTIYLCIRSHFLSLSLTKFLQNLLAMVCSVYLILFSLNLTIMQSCI